MFLYELYRPECIKVALEAEDKDEAFEEMVDFYCSSVNLNAREEILDAIRERENKMSTGIKKGIAIPHGKTSAVDSISGMLGISRKGVDYDALDGEPVYILFMILAPVRDTELHLKVLKRLAELLDNPQFYTELAIQNDAQGAWQVIKKYEEILSTRN
jgi:PTS system fructose-specific IIC component/PTS system nitrogen regulatory IIA component